jgi:general stress protein 26
MGTTKNLMDDKGLEKLKELIDSAKICHFVTALDKRPLAARPMGTQEVDNEGTIWFFSGKSSDKNQDIKNSPEVQLFYSQTGNSEYLSVYGHAEIIVDKAKIEELWNPLVKTWFNGGKEDPELTLIKVVPKEVYYWDTKHNKYVSLAKILVGSIVGKQMDDGVQGKINI